MHNYCKISGSMKSIQANESDSYSENFLSRSDLEHPFSCKNDNFDFDLERLKEILDEYLFQ